MGDSAQGAVIEAANHEPAHRHDDEAIHSLARDVKAGGAEAPAILAVLSAMGACVHPSSNDGLSALMLAAERGWRGSLARRPARVELSWKPHFRGTRRPPRSTRGEGFEWIVLSQFVRGRA